MKTLLTLLSLLVAQTLHAANPSPVISEVTQTSALISWEAVPDAVSYRVDELTSGSYGQIWETVARGYTDLFWSVELSALSCRSFKFYQEPAAAGFVTPVTVCRLAPPSVGYASCYKPTRTLPRLPYTGFYAGLLYRCTFYISGNPKPIVTLTEGPPGMVLTGNTLTWIGYDATHVTLHLENSEGVVDFGYALTAQ